MKHSFFSLICTLALMLGACSDDQAGPTSGTAPTEETGNDESSTDELPIGDASGVPCDEEGAKYCDIDALYQCTNGAWEIIDLCSEPMTCSNTELICVDKICDRGDRRCADSSSVEFCQPDQTGWSEPQDCGEGIACVDGTCAVPECFPGVMFLVDRSSSMQDNWQPVRNSISNVIRENESVRFGLTGFPSAAPPDSGLFGSLSGCHTGESWPNLPIEANAADTIENWFDDNGVNGSTPLEGAMEWFAQNAGSVWQGEESGYLVVLSDGADTCSGGDSCGPECIAEYLAIHTRALGRSGIKTYVIGYNYGDSPTELNSIAANGGTSFNEYVNAGNEDMLNGIFEDFIREIKDCQ